MSDILYEVKGISYDYPESAKASVYNCSFNLAKGEVVAICGESGCGKSTLLKIMAGLFAPTSGQLWMNNKKLPNPEHMLIPGYDGVTLVHQDFELFPRYTVAQNVAHSLRRLDPSVRDQRVAELLERARLSDLSDNIPLYLSGGEKQRLAIVKAVAESPTLLLLDEPFSQLDFPNKRTLKNLIEEINKQEEVTVLITSHDGSDILSISDRVIVMKDAQVVEQSFTTEVYFKPQTPYSAGLFGDYVWFSDHERELYKLTTSVLRPNQIHLSEKGIVNVEVINKHYFGSFWRIQGLDQDGKLWIFDDQEGSKAIGDKISLGVR